MKDSLVNHIQPPWNEALAELAAPSWDGKDISARGIRTSILDCNREQILFWVAKLKWDLKGLKLPSYVPRKNRETFKPMGAVFRRLLEFCIQCHLVDSDCHDEYDDPAEWFAYIFTELFGSADSRLRNEGQDEYIKSLQKENKLLRCYKNPYSENEDPHTYKLIESAFILRSCSKVFRKDCWNHYLTARSAWVTDLQSCEYMKVLREDKHVPTCPAMVNPRLRCECIKITTDERSFYTQLGQGRARQKVMLPKTVIEQITKNQL